MQYKSCTNGRLKTQRPARFVACWTLHRWCRTRKRLRNRIALLLQLRRENVVLQDALQSRLRAQSEHIKWPEATADGVPATRPDPPRRARSDNEAGHSQGTRYQMEARGRAAARSLNKPRESRRRPVMRFAFWPYISRDTTHSRRPHMIVTRAVHCCQNRMRGSKARTSLQGQLNANYSPCGKNFDRAANLRRSFHKDEETSATRKRRKQP